jgi:formate dehydrogenase major subunit
VICKLGRFIPLDEQRERILSPMIKQDGKLKVATWEKALEAIEAKFKPLVGKKDDGVAAIASPRLTAEALYAFKSLFADGFKSEMVTTTDEGAFTTPQSALAEELKTAFEGDLDAVDTADSILVLNADLVNDHQVASFFVKRNVSKTAKLVVVDNKDNDLSAIASQTLKISNGDYLNVIKGITKAVEKLGLSKEKVQGDPDKDLETAAKLSGISTEAYLKTAVILASAEKPVIVYDVKNLTEDSVITLKALMELAKVCGAVSISTKGLANSTVAAQYKLTKGFKVNGHQAVFAAIADEEPTQKLVKTLESAGFLVVQASYHSKLTAMADIVLPVEIWAEQEGHFVNLEGKLQKANKVLNASEDIRSNADVLNTIAGLVIPEIKGQLENWQERLSDRVSATLISE